MSVQAKVCVEQIVKLASWSAITSLAD